jgi:hypothetical protein
MTLNMTRETARFLAIVAVYGLIGPPIGAVVFLASVTAEVLLISKNAVETTGDVFSALAEPAIYANISVGAYAFGFGPALAAGLVIGILQAFFGGVASPIVVAGGIVAGFYHFVRVGGLGLFFVGMGSPLAGWSDLVVPILAGAMSTALCWAIARRWRLIERLADVVT